MREEPVCPSSILEEMVYQKQVEAASMSVEALRWWWNLA
jgi:hypothetical protein